MKLIRLLPIGLVLACLPLLAAPAQRDVSPREARQIGQERQKDARRQAKRAQQGAKQRQKEVARQTKRRDSERRRETKRLTKSRRKQGKQVEAHAGQSEKPPPPPSKGDGPSKQQPSPIERLRGYSGSAPKQ
ncbi:MAG: hypothetical protein O3A53_06095 [Acidobacteria bacterium]|nr:hypothetical protein [Acidobacteriota bacterium]MDA1234352.1 hypothetical protein [Acidobacteriota bacterium]